MAPQTGSLISDFGEIPTSPSSTIFFTSTMGRNASDDVCRSYANFDYQIPMIIVCAACFATGLICCFFGYRFFKAVLFLTGFLFGSVLIYLVCEREQLLPTFGNAGVAVGAGVLFGLVTMLVSYVGLFMAGFLNGLFLGVVILAVWASVTPPGTMWATVGVLFSVGILCALCSLKWQRVLFIANTSLVGSALLATALDYFAERLSVVERFWEAVNIQEPRWTGVCWYGWLLLSVWPCLFVVGSLVQWRWTSVGYDHKEGCRHFRRQRLVNGRATEAAPATARGRSESYAVNQPSRGSTGNAKAYEPRPWRSIYQSRRTHGDVICQSYLESLQRLSSQHQLAPQRASITDTPTLASGHTRLTVLTNESGQNSYDSAKS